MFPISVLTSLTWNIYVLSLIWLHMISESWSHWGDVKILFENPWNMTWHWKMDDFFAFKSLFLDWTLSFRCDGSQDRHWNQLSLGSLVTGNIYFLSVPSDQTVSSLSSSSAASSFKTTYIQNGSRAHLGAQFMSQFFNWCSYQIENSKKQTDINK